jgi:hypothetical protein
MKIQSIERTVLLLATLPVGSGVGGSVGGSVGCGVGSSVGVNVVGGSVGAGDGSGVAAVEGSSVFASLKAVTQSCRQG